MRPSPDHGSGQDGTTGTRTKAVTKRIVSTRVIHAMKAHGMTPIGWQVRSLTATLIANDDAPTEEQVIAALMKAVWFPKPRRRQWRVGEGGGWATRS